MKRLLGILLLAPAVVLAGCIRTERQVEVTPGTVPAEIRGATWAETPPSYCVVRSMEEGFVDHETLVELAQRAFATWGIETEYDGDCPGAMEQNNGRNEITWGSLGAGGESLAKAGNTNIRYRTQPITGSSAEITEADIILDNQPPSGKDTEECLFTTLLHEAGHFLGLHHLDTSTVMSPVIMECRQELTQGDREALEEIY